MYHQHEPLLLPLSVTPRPVFQTYKNSEGSSATITVEIAGLVSNVNETTLI